METSIIELAALVQKVVGQGVGVQHGLPRQGDIRRNYSTINKARRMLDWYLQVELQEGLQQVWTWFSAQMGDVQ